MLFVVLASLTALSSAYYNANTKIIDNNYSDDSIVSYTNLTSSHTVPNDFLSYRIDDKLLTWNDVNGLPDDEQYAHVVRFNLYSDDYGAYQKDVFRWWFTTDGEQTGYMTFHFRSLVQNDNLRYIFTYRIYNSYYSGYYTNSKDVKVYDSIDDNFDLYLGDSSVFNQYELANEHLYISYRVQVVPVDDNEFYLLQNGVDSYERGYDAGYVEGYGDGYDVGHGVGYSEGATDSNTYTFERLFGAIADTPILFLRQMFNFQLFGVSMINIVFSLITGAIVLYVIRKVIL